MAQALALEVRLSLSEAVTLSLALEVPLGPTAIGLTGPSGSGKTTLLRVLAGLTRPEEGKIAFSDEIWLDTRAGIEVPPFRRELGYVPQESSLFPHLTVAENVAYGLVRATSRERERAVREEIAFFGLEALEGRFPSQLSGGQRQRVALARAAAVAPRLLLLDEPFSALDTIARGILADRLFTRFGASATPVFLVTHDEAEADRLATHRFHLVEGRLQQPGRD